MNKFEEYYINNNKCISLRQKPECDYLRISNYLSEYQTEQEKQQVLDNLGITSRLQDVFNTLNEKFNQYVTLKFLDEYFVKKVDLYYPEDEDDEDADFESLFDRDDSDYSSGGGWKVDDFLSLVSLNPVQNRIITEALNNKADISTLDGYVSIDNLSKYLGGYQLLLEAGFGIKIEGNKISTTLDLNPFIFVEKLPTTGDPNKIYLVPDPEEEGSYIQYNYSVGKGWIELGKSNLGGIFSGYLTASEADNRYIKKGEISNVATLTAIKEILKGYVKKSEVYTPDQYNSDETSSEIIDDIINNGGGSGVLPDSGNGGTVTVNITVDSFLNSGSQNPVQNKVIVTALESKQDKLEAGEGIIIENGIISSTFDTSLYEFVTTLPLTNIKTNKIYLVEQPNSSEFQEYVYRDGQWKYKGTRDLGVDLTKYLSKEQAQNLYASKADLTGYITRNEFNIATGGGINLDQYATKEYVNSLLSGLDKETLDKLLELKAELLKGDTAFSQLTIALGSKANIADVYTKSECDTLFQRAGNFLTTEAFNGYYNQLTNKIDAIIVDQTLSATSENPVWNKTVTKALEKKLSIDIAENTYVKKDDLQNQLEELDLSNKLKFKTINNNSILGEGNISIIVPQIDETLTENSINPVSSSGIYSFITYKLSSKQHILTAGRGISIQNDVISVIADSNPFIIVDSRPETGQENKLYLVKENQIYRQYLYRNGEWLDQGILDFSIDLSAYLRIADANFATPNDISSLRNWVNTTFVKKSDVYTPEQQNTTSDQLDISIGENTGSTSILPDDPNHVSISSNYESNIADGVRTNVAVGNITVGTDSAQLKGKSFSEIFDRIFFKEIWNNPNYRHNIGISVSNKLVKVGTPIQTPTITAEWNSEVLPQSTISTQLKIRKPNTQSNEDYIPGESYNIPGNYTFILIYSYPEGEYEVTSNYGNTKQVTLSSGQGNFTETVQATYPWYINNEEQSVLVPINQSYTTEIFLTGSPKISIPCESSICTIQADLGLGYMDVNWTQTTEVRNGVIYSVWTKEDAYLQDVKHKITFTIYNI